MQSGQGGIRWNSVTKKIQLMDENKNWVDWQSYDPDKKVVVIEAPSDSSTVDLHRTITVQQSGIYIVMTASLRNYASTITSTGTVLNYVQPLGVGFKFAIINASANNTIKVDVYVEGTEMALAAIYYLPGVSRLKSDPTYTNSWRYGTSLNYTNGIANCIFGAAVASRNADNLSLQTDFQGERYYKYNTRNISSFCAIPDSNYASATFTNTYNAGGFIVYCNFE